MESTGRQWLVIFNPASGTGRKSGLDIAIQAGLREKGISAQVHITSRPGEATEIAARESGRFEVIVAAGGDGTVRETASGLFGTESALGILPLGSGNGLARHVGISRRLNEAIDQLASARIHTADAYQINGRHGVNVGGIGFDGEIARLFSHQKRRGLTGYLQLIRSGFSRYPEFRIEVIEEGRVRTMPAFMVCTANGSQFGNNAFIARGAQISDGMLDIRILRKPSWLQAAGLFLSLYRGADSKLVSGYQTDSFIIQTSSPQPVHADGDFIGITDRLEVRLLPAAYRILIPKNI